MYARGRCARESIILVSYAARRNQVSPYRACVKRGIGRADAAGVQRMKATVVPSWPESLGRDDVPLSDMKLES